MSRVCLDCAGPVSVQSKFGRCRACTARRLVQDPKVVEARRVGKARIFADPELRAAYGEKFRQAMKRRMAENPGLREQIVRMGKTQGVENFKKSQDPEVRARAGLSIRRKALAWCPEEHWDLNAQLKSKGIPLPERKQIILEMVPGTIEHARRTVANNNDAMRIRHERDLASRY